jgi:hypothetical protein
MELTERKKADRLAMAAALEKLILAHGATFERLEPAPLSPRAIWLQVRAPRGLCVTVDLDGDSCQPDVHVLSWHIAQDSDARLSDRLALMGSINTHHWSKATMIAEGFESLCRALEFGLEAARDGSAFSPEREAAAIAKNGTAAERQARFDAWRDEVLARPATA